ncbi:hypothetical protein Raf01_43210 [Rugosimonospora africana]|uniref:Uncharacterized protein n=2 Tax=Rugosimonospora africana TaxID=556532 RepID=A0A8J3VRH8_9ACTN|nr:hypothetical protein Raf01_43210 [Rugosimonospora africana]
MIDGYAFVELVATGDADTGTRPVPVTVWHVAEADHTAPTGEAEDGGRFDTVLAGMIVASYARPRGTIVTLGHDPALAGAAGAYGCDYRTVTTPADLAGLDHVAGQITLVVLPWPPNQDRQIELDALRDMFAACRALLARDGVTCVALTTNPARDGYDQHASALISAAGDSGLELIRHILAVTEPVTGPHGHLRLAPTAQVSLVDRLQLHIRKHVLLFVIGGDRG